MMLENECLCMFFEMFSLIQYVPLCVEYHHPKPFGKKRM
jgi:hypothetical protein